MSIDPPVFEDRRSLPDRRQHDRPPRDQTRAARVGIAAVVAIAGGLVLIYVFFGTIGGVDFADAAVATGVAAVLALVWLGGYWYRQRTRHPRGPDAVSRERRGF
jgi:Na+-driven multidrug efflux pump